MHVAARSSPPVELDGVSFGYRGGTPALEACRLRSSEGAFVGVAGPNGGGKTTLLRLPLGLERPTLGTRAALRPASQDVGGAARIGYVPQRAQSCGGDAP